LFQISTGVGLCVRERDRGTKREKKKERVCAGITGT